MKQSNKNTERGGGYLVWRPCSRLVLVIGEDEERQCAELRMLQGGVKLVSCRLEVFIRWGAVQYEDYTLRPLVVATPIFLDVVGSCGETWCRLISQLPDGVIATHWCGLSKDNKGSYKKHKVKHHLSFLWLCARPKPLKTQFCLATTSVCVHRWPILVLLDDEGNASKEESLLYNDDYTHSFLLL